MKRKIELIEKDLSGKTIVFTGGTDGMGRVAVDRLSKMGATLIILGRNKLKTESVVNDLNQLTGKKNSRYVHCDLSSLASVRSAAKEILEICPKIDILINCAGAQPGPVRKESVDGFELNWAVNHLGPFLLTHLLLDRLKEFAPARIVNLSSALEKDGHIDFDDLQLKNSFSILKAYPNAKLAVIMWTKRMAKDLMGSKVSINALNPGHIKTNLGRDLKGWSAWIGKPLTFFLASDPEVGAARIIRLAISDEYQSISGKFIYEDHIKSPNAEALDQSIVERVWKISKQQVGII